MRLRQGCRGWWLMALAFLADQISKRWVRGLSGRRELIPGVLRLRPVRNTGMAFSMLSGHFWLLTLATAAIIAALVAWLLKKPEEPPLMRAGF